MADAHSTKERLLKGKPQQEKPAPSSTIPPKGTVPLAEAPRVYASGQIVTHKGKEHLVIPLNNRPNEFYLADQDFCTRALLELRVSVAEDPHMPVSKAASRADTIHLLLDATSSKHSAMFVGFKNANSLGVLRNLTHLLREYASSKLGELDKKKFVSNSPDSKPLEIPDRQKEVTITRIGSAPYLELKVPNQRGIIYLADESFCERALLALITDYSSLDTPGSRKMIEKLESLFDTPKKKSIRFFKSFSTINQEGNLPILAELITLFIRDYPKRIDSEKVTHGYHAPAQASPAAVASAIREILDSQDSDSIDLVVLQEKLREKFPSSPLMIPFLRNIYQQALTLPSKRKEKVEEPDEDEEGESGEESEDSQSGEEDEELAEAPEDEEDQDPELIEEAEEPDEEPEEQEEEPPERIQLEDDLPVAERKARLAERMRAAERGSTRRRPIVVSKEKEPEEGEEEPPESEEVSAAPPQPQAVERSPVPQPIPIQGEVLADGLKKLEAGRITEGSLVVALPLGTDGAEPAKQLFALMGHGTCDHKMNKLRSHQSREGGDKELDDMDEYDGTLLDSSVVGLKVVRNLKPFAEIERQGNLGMLAGYLAKYVQLFPNENKDLRIVDENGHLVQQKNGKPAPVKQPKQRAPPLPLADLVASASEFLQADPTLKYPTLLAKLQVKHPGNYSERYLKNTILPAVYTQHPELERKVVSLQELAESTYTILTDQAHPENLAMPPELIAQELVRKHPHNKLSKNYVRSNILLLMFELHPEIKQAREKAIADAKEKDSPVRKYAEEIIPIIRAEPTLENKELAKKMQELHPEGLSSTTVGRAISLAYEIDPTLKQLRADAKLEQASKKPKKRKLHKPFQSEIPQPFLVKLHALMREVEGNAPGSEAHSTAVTSLLAHIRSLPQFAKGVKVSTEELAHSTYKLLTDPEHPKNIGLDPEAIARRLRKLHPMNRISGGYVSGIIVPLMYKLYAEKHPTLKEERAKLYTSTRTSTPVGEIISWIVQRLESSEEKVNIYKLHDEIKAQFPKNKWGRGNLTRVLTLAYKEKAGLKAKIGYSHVRGAVGGGRPADPLTLKVAEKLNELKTHSPSISIQELVEKINAVEELKRADGKPYEYKEIVTILSRYVYPSHPEWGKKARANLSTLATSVYTILTEKPENMGLLAEEIAEKLSPLHPANKITPAYVRSVILPATYKLYAETHPTLQAERSKALAERKAILRPQRERKSKPGIPPIPLDDTPATRIAERKEMIAWVIARLERQPRESKVDVYALQAEIKAKFPLNELNELKLRVITTFVYRKNKDLKGKVSRPRKQNQIDPLSLKIADKLVELKKQFPSATIPELTEKVNQDSSLHKNGKPLKESQVANIWKKHVIPTHQEFARASLDELAKEMYSIFTEKPENIGMSGEAIAALLRIKFPNNKITGKYVNTQISGRLYSLHEKDRPTLKEERDRATKERRREDGTYGGNSPTELTINVVARLTELLLNDPLISAKDLANTINEEFKPPKLFSKHYIDNLISTHVYAKHPEIREKRKQKRRLIPAGGKAPEPITLEVAARIEEIRRTSPKLTLIQITEIINEEFKGKHEPYNPPHIGVIFRKYVRKAHPELAYGRTANLDSSDGEKKGTGRKVSEKTVNIFSLVEREVRKNPGINFSLLPEVVKSELGFDITAHYLEVMYSKYASSELRTLRSNALASGTKRAKSNLRKSKPSEKVSNILAVLEAQVRVNPTVNFETIVPLVKDQLGYEVSKHYLEVIFSSHGSEEVKDLRRTARGKAPLEKPPREEKTEEPGKPTRTLEGRRKGITLAMLGNYAKELLEFDIHLSNPALAEKLSKHFGYTISADYISVILSPVFKRNPKLKQKRKEARNS